MDFYHLLENIRNNYFSLKTASKKVVHETGELLGNKLVDAVNKSSNNQIVKHESV